MTIHKALHPRDDVNRLYVSKKEGGRGLVSTEDSVDTLIQRLEDYIQKRGGRQITATRNNTNDTRISRTIVTRKQKSEEKQLCGCFKRLTSNTSNRKTGTWLGMGNLKKDTESLLIAAQNNAIRTNDIKARVDKTQQNSRCRLCDDRDETINHILSECGKLAQKENKTRHDWAGKVIHKELSKKLKFVHTNKCYMNNPEVVLENETYQLLWDFDIQTDHLMPVRRPDRTIVDKKDRTCRTVDFAFPMDHRVKLKESKKSDKYLDLARELKKLWNMKVTVIPIVIGTLSTITKRLV